MKDTMKSFGDGLSGAIDKSSDEIGKAINKTERWSTAWRNVGDAFRNFVADFLKQIGQLMVKKAIMGMLGVDDKKDENSPGGLMQWLTGGKSGGKAALDAKKHNAPAADNDFGSIVNKVFTRNRTDTSGTGSIGDAGGTAGKYSASDAAALIKKVGGTDEEAKTLGAIAMAESRGRPDAHNPNAKTGDNSYGLWQVNMLGSMEQARLKKYGLNSKEDLFDPETNARVALQMKRDRKGYGDWSTYNKGTHEKYLDSVNPGEKKSPGVDMEPTGTIEARRGLDGVMPKPDLFKAPDILPKTVDERIADAGKVADRESKIAAERARMEALRKKEEQEAESNSSDNMPDASLPTVPNVPNFPLPPPRPSNKELGLDSSDLSDAPLPPPRPSNTELGLPDPSAGAGALAGAAGGLGGMGGGMMSAATGLAALMGSATDAVGGKAKTPLESFLPMLGLAGMAASVFLRKRHKKKQPSFGTSGPVQWGILHEGGLASDDIPTRSLNLGSVIRMHTGGIAGGGLGPNEVPRILDKHEEVLTKNDPRHIMNGGGKGGAAPQKPVSLKVVNAFDPGTALQHALDTPHGEQAIMNHVRSNSDAYKGILG